ncbi:MAG TPA: Rdx family protein [Bryobacteraceae bacterium]|nr:Rdx family protein [Bryobacteraceae bacterium]
MSLKNRVEPEFGVPVRVRAGAPGSLDVYLNGEQIYSKRRSGRMPTAEELIKLIRGKVSSN